MRGFVSLIDSCCFGNSLDFIVEWSRVENLFRYLYTRGRSSQCYDGNITNSFTVLLAPNAFPDQHSSPSSADSPNKV